MRGDKVKLLSRLAKWLRMFTMGNVFEIIEEEKEFRIKQVE